MTDDPQTNIWWQNAVVYQVYIRSFADGNDDGTGDIKGLSSRLRYLSELGIDAIWITPWYPSPLRDGGYDVSDHRDIDPRFGTIEEAEKLILNAHSHGLRVIVDIVPNHTSSDHRWFQEALAAGPGSKARERYIFRPGSGPEGDQPPTNWESVFGGPAWEPTGDGEWYLHLFDISQPDLNWNNPEVVAEFDQILRFWLDRGVDGFRIDVAHGMIKDTSFPDIYEPAELLLPSCGSELRPGTGFADIDHSTQLLGRGKGANHPHWNRPEVHQINRRWRKILDEYDNRMMVAEAWLPSDELTLYLRDDEYHQSFNFDLLESPWDASQMAEIIEQSCYFAQQVSASSTWVLSNHDVMRHATRYGLPADTDWRAWHLKGSASELNQSLGDRRARAVVLITMALPGSSYVYQGEELGLPDVWDLPAEALEDPVWERSGFTQRGRDGCRVPIPWTASGQSCGFSQGPAQPWLPQPDVFRQLAVDRQEDSPKSMLELYRKAIRLRREVIGPSPHFRLLDTHPGVLAFERSGGFCCMVNMSTQPLPLPEGRVILSSEPVEGGDLPSDVGIWLLTS